MKTYKILITSAAALLLSYGAIASTDIPGNAMEMNVKRMGDLLFRYTRFNSESSNPCLRAELINPQDSWKIVESKDICEINGRQLTDLSYFGFDSFHFKNNKLLFKFNFLERSTHGEYSQDCFVLVSENKIGKLECSLSYLAD